MECVHCKGKMEKSEAPFSVERKGYHIHWNAVPAWVCMQCGEPFFSVAEVERIQNILSLIDKEQELLAAS